MAVFYLSDDWVVFHCIYVPHFFIQSYFKGHFGCFHVSATMNNAALRVHVSLVINVFFFSHRYPEKVFLGHMISLLFIFLATSILFSIVLFSLLSHQQWMRVVFFFSLQLLWHLLLLILLIIAILTAVSGHLTSFILLFPDS